jgi:hypothetical protein
MEGKNEREEEWNKKKKKEVEDEPLVRMLPFPVDDLERNVLVGRAGGEDDGGDLGLVFVFDDAVGGRFLGVDEIGIEDADGEGEWVKRKKDQTRWGRKEGKRKTPKDV